ncbi:MAG TPA: gluconokinase [Candidatus Acidoferrum sp.]|nr:gluconokinase [Candidatus Acidoferrum sp.]
MIVLIMGPAGSGKTTIGELLAKQLSWEFADGDDFHSAANKEKMSNGIPLTDEDRLPWLQSIRDAMKKWQAQGQSAVVACSALKRSYRNLLGVGPNANDVKLVYLKGNYDLLLERLHSRKGHYMKEQMLSSQLADLEEPTASITIDISNPPRQIVCEIRAQLGL